MAKTVELRRAEKYNIAGIIFEKGVPKIVNDALAAILEEKYDSQDVPMFKVSQVKKSDIPPAPAPKPVEVVEEPVGMTDEQLAELEEKQAAAQADLDSPVEGEGTDAVAAAAAGKIKITKKAVPAGEPKVTV